MVLESLLTLIETLKERIAQHGPQLRANETLTRYALVDPLLRELGWDTSDPASVEAEHRLDNNQVADYVLRSDDRVVMVVESKKLDQPLRGGRALEQGLVYCAYTGSGYFALTDGRRWEVFESGSTEPKVSFDLVNEPAAEVCLNALALLRPAVQSGHVSVGQTPIAGQAAAVAETPPTAPQVSQPVAATAVPTNPGDWQQIDSLGDRRGTPPPAEMLFPDGSRRPIKSWTALTIESVRWLDDKQLFAEHHLPISRGPKSKLSVVALTPFHPSGDPMKKSAPAGSLHVDKTHYGERWIPKTIRIIKHVDQDPAQFKVRFVSES